MGLYIKDLGMPKEGAWYNIVITSNGKGFVDVVREDNALTGTEFIQAVEISTPHGRLIDENKILLTNLEIFMCDGSYKEALKLLCEKIDDAPTILEAEE